MNDLIIWTMYASIGVILTWILREVRKKNVLE
jgi:hypothetical protein